MKKKEMNGLARNLVEYMFSRNNDINGYWGIGVLCALAKIKGLHKFAFKIIPGKVITIYGCEITDSVNISRKMTKYGLSSIEARMSYFEDGRFDNGKDRYTCSLAIAVTQLGRTGLYMSNISCWPHDATIEIKRAGKYIKESNGSGLLNRIYKLFNPA